MKPDLCANLQAMFPDYLDGTVPGRAMQEISQHLEGTESVAPCGRCAAEFGALRSLQTAVASLRPAPVPADLNLRLRVAISRENARRNTRWVDTMSLAWDNAVRPMLLQVSAGVVGTVALVGSILLLLGVVAAPPSAVMANDEPLGAITAPHYLYSSVEPGAIATDRDATIVVEASIDSLGRVYDYTIVSGPADDTVRAQVVNQLLSSVFKPASVFGLPIRGRVVRTFSGISVHA